VASAHRCVENLDAKVLSRCEGFLWSCCARLTSRWGESIGLGPGAMPAVIVGAEPVDGEVAIVAFWSRAEQRWSSDGVPTLFTNLWLSVVEPVHVIEWPDEDVLVLSAASRMV